MAITLVQVDFPHQGPWGAEMAEAFEGLAQSIAQEPGFLFKYWTEDQAQGIAGGVYAFASRPEAEAYMGSSFQFCLPDWEDDRVRVFLAGAVARGVELKWFGAEDPVAFTSRYPHWRYAGAQSCPATDRILRGLVDMRLPLTFTPVDAALIARILRDEALRAGQAEITGPVAAPEVQ